MVANHKQLPGEKEGGFMTIKKIVWILIAVALLVFGWIMLNWEVVIIN